MPSEGSSRFDRVRIEPAEGVVSPALSGLYGDQAPRVSVASLSPARPDRLLLVLAFDCEDHFHYSSVGVRRLAPGWEHELSFRLRIEDDDREPPAWPVRLIARYASHLSRASLSLAAGSYVRLNEPADEQGRWRAFALVADPVLSATHLAIVALHDRELERWGDRGWREAAAALAARSPLLVTGERPCLV